MNINIVVYNDKMDIIGQLDCDDNSMEITYQLADIKEPEKRKSNMVRNFTLPGTKNNNQIFNGIFENGYVVGKYNPNLRLVADVIVNNNQFFRGNLQLNRINKINNKLIGYEVTIYGTLADMFGEMGDAQLTSLDFSEYNHIFNVENIMSTWLTGSGLTNLPTNVEATAGYFGPYNLTNYIYKNGVKVLNPSLGDGYVYPLYYNGQTTNEYDVSTNYFQPSIYTYTIMKKIFNNYGFKWKSNFLESNYFKRLINTPTKDKFLVKQEELDNQGFLANYGIKQTKASWILKKTVPSNVASTYAGSKVVFDNDSVAPAQDPGNKYSTSTGYFTVGKNGTFRLSVYLDLRCVYRGNNGFNSPNLIPGLFNIVGGPITGIAYIKRSNGSVLASQTFQFQHASTPQAPGYTIQATPLIDATANLSVGEQYYVDFEVTIPSSNFAAKTINLSGQAFASNIDFYVASPAGQDLQTRFSATVVDKSVSDGDNLNINDAIPDMSIKDFITSINKMFNLYWVPTNNDREFVIEPRDSLYGDYNQVVDWSDIVDNGEIVSIDPLYDITANSYKLTYKEDSDYYNADYNTINGEVYGTKNYKIENDFVVEEFTIETGFSASPLLKIDGSNMVATPFVSKNNNVFTRSNPKPRILIFGGIKYVTGTSFLIKNAYSTTKMPKYLAQNWNTAKWFFPYAGHLDDPYTPSEDINYSICKNYYFNWDNITNNNLYNKYWKNNILEVTDKDSHLLTAKVVIPDVEMLNFDLRWIIQVDNVYYRVNKLTWSPISGLGEVELIRAKNIKPFSPRTLSYLDTWTGGVDRLNQVPFSKQFESIEFVSEKKPPFVFQNELLSKRFLEFEATYQFTGTNLFNSIGNIRKTPSFEVIPTQSYFEGDTKSNNVYSKQAGHIVQGEFNWISPEAKSITIVGDNNKISKSKNISIQGNNNTVVAGVENVSIVGDGITAVESNVSYVSGMKVREGQILKEVNMVVSPSDSSGISRGLLVGGKNSTITSNGCKSKGLIIGGSN